ncbi:MAG: acetyl-CoA decarbonylase/synthase complex subunit delta [Methanomicrobiales archaeon]|nr:acetyl-CoA decarbonylase/synthase complex subunit delta [Methanomicrobiales archaeon]
MTWSGEIDRVHIGATKQEGGTRSRVCTVGGAKNLPFLEGASEMPLIALEICDDTGSWSPIVLAYTGDVTRDAGEWAKKAEKEFGADLVRLHLTSTRKRGFSDVRGVRTTIEAVLQGTGLPLIIEGSNEPSVDSEVFSACGEAAAGERALLGTAEADRYRSVAAAAVAFGHGVIAQSPIDINLAKQLNILLHEIGMPHDRIVIDPFTGALGYGFEYSYSVMERIRTAALKGDTDLAMPMISAAADSLNIKEVREAPQEVRDETAVMWEFCAAFSAAVAGAEIVCVRHPRTLEKLKKGFAHLAGEG